MRAIVGVHVHAPKAVAADHRDRIADRAEQLAERVQVGRVGAKEVLDLVRVRGRRFVTDGRQHFTGAGAGRRSSDVAARCARQRFEDDDQAHPAGVDNPGGGQRRHLLGRPRQRLRRGARSRNQLAGDVAVRALRRVGRGGHDAQDRPLGRLENRVVRELGRALERARNLVRVGGPRFDGIGERAQDLGQDDAGVAARAHKRPTADRARDGGRLGRRAVERRDDGFHRHHEVRPGVRVRDREDVGGVDRRPRRAQIIERRNDGSPERAGVKNRAHAATLAAETDIKPRSRGPDGVVAAFGGRYNPPPLWQPFVTSVAAVRGSGCRYLTRTAVRRAVGIPTSSGCGRWSRVTPSA